MNFKSLPDYPKPRSSLVNTLMSSETLMETTKMLSCAMISVNAAYVSNIEKTDCSYFPL